MANTLYVPLLAAAGKVKVLSNSLYSYIIICSIIKYKVANLIPNLI